MGGKPMAEYQKQPVKYITFMITPHTVSRHNSYIRIDSVYTKSYTVHIDGQRERLMNRTVQRSVELMRLIAASEGGMTINELTDATAIPKTTLYDIIVTLEDQGMLQCTEGAPRRYTIGLTAFLLGSHYAAAIDLIETAKPHMEKLSGLLNRTVFLGILDDVHILYIDKSSPAHTIYGTAELYSRSDVYCTSLGKAILAHMDDASPILDRITFTRYTPHTIADRDSLLTDLARTRDRGYAVDDRELIPQIACVGAPVFDRTGRVCAALSAVGLYDPARDMDGEGAALRETALEISVQLGYAVRRQA